MSQKSQNSDGPGIDNDVCPIFDDYVCYRKDMKICKGKVLRRVNNCV